MGVEPDGASLADLNGDGRLDLLGVASWANTVAIHNGALYFWFDPQGGVPDPLRCHVPDASTSDHLGR